MASSEEPVSVAAVEAANEDDLNENRETTLLAASPSKILNARTAARYSRGNPCFAKPVQVSLDFLNQAYKLDVWLSTLALFLFLLCQTSGMASKAD